MQNLSPEPASLMTKKEGSAGQIRGAGLGEVCEKGVRPEGQSTLKHPPAACGLCRKKLKASWLEVSEDAGVMGQGVGTCGEKPGSSKQRQAGRKHGRGQHRCPAPHRSRSRGVKAWAKPLQWRETHTCGVSPGKPGPAGAGSSSPQTHNRSGGVKHPSTLCSLKLF